MKHKCARGKWEYETAENRLISQYESFLRARCNITLRVTNSLPRSAVEREIVNQ